MEKIGDPSEPTKRIINRAGTNLPRMHSMSIRVAYQETDGQGRVHHGNYLNYFERGRVEMLRAGGISYKYLESTGIMLVVSEMNIRYAAGAEFDDLLVLTTELMEIRKVRIRHRYTMFRGAELVVEADSVIACVDRAGNPRRLPDLFFAK
jgi:acyl-CoA thioester hydrolase